MENGRFVTYTDKDRDIVRKGICEIAKVLLGDDTQRKLSMLFCLVLVYGSILSAGYK